MDTDFTQGADAATYKPVFGEGEEHSIIQAIRADDPTRAKEEE